MNAVTLVFVALCVFAVAYRYYGLFIANQVLAVKQERVTPAVALADGHDYHKTNKFVLFGHHFAAIAAAGPLLGPVLAAQFGYLPGALWIIIGCVLAGAVHDMVVLFASVRHKGKSLSLIADHEIGTGDADVINADRVAQVCGSDWGFWRTVNHTIDTVEHHARSDTELEDQRERVLDAIATLRDQLERAPKSAKWKLRAKVGDRKIWYALPEDPDRHPSMA